MAKVINNLVIDHVLRGIMLNKANEYMWSINQITNPSLSVSLSDTAQAVDALGTPIAEFDRGRSAEFSAENSIFDLGLYAAQMGREKEIASSTNKITTPSFEEVEVKGTSGETYETKHVPNKAITTIWKLNGDGTMGEIYTANTEANATQFVFKFDNDDNPTKATITLPTGLKKDETLFVFYEYEASENVVAATADAINFPKRGKFYLDVLGANTCNQEELIHAYVYFPNAKLDGNVDYSFTTDGTHSFTVRAMQDYCDRKKILFKIIIPDEE